MFLVHKMDGTYASYTGYKNVPSMIAHYAEIVVTEEEDKTLGDKDDDYVKKVAEVVYLTNEVYTTDGKVVAYVGKCAENDVRYINNTEYHALTIYVDGEAKEIYVDDASYDAYFKSAEFDAGFYEFLNTDVEETPVAKTVTKFAEEDDKLYLGKSVNITVLGDEEIKVDEAKDDVYTYSYTDDVAFYVIDDNEVDKSTLADLQFYFGLDPMNVGDDGLDVNGNGPAIKAAHEVYMVVDGTEVSAVYMILEYNE